MGTKIYEGNLVIEAQEIVDVFKQLLNGHHIDRVIGQEENPLPVNEELVPPPSIEEVGLAIKKLKNSKAAGSDGLPAELFKYGGDVLVGSMRRIINQVWVPGFRPGRSTIDQIFTLRQIMEKTNEFQVETHHLFIDFKAAYDSIRTWVPINKNTFLQVALSLVNCHKLLTPSWLKSSSTCARHLSRCLRLFCVVPLGWYRRLFMPDDLC